jgi:hypothetical protein
MMIRKYSKVFIFLLTYKIEHIKELQDKLIEKDQAIKKSEDEKKVMESTYFY